MEIGIGDAKGSTVIAINGDIDMYTSPALREKLMGLVKGKPPVVVLDFSKVSYIDSSGIATFVEGLKGMKSYGGRLKFFGVSAGIREIFSFSKLDRVFEIYDSFDDAVKK